MEQKEIDDILLKYRKKLENHIDVESLGEVQPEGTLKFSKEYQRFRKEALSVRVGVYETWCNIAEKILAFTPSKKDQPVIQEAIETSHLEITPNGAASLAALSALILIFIGIGIGLVAYALTGQISFFWPLFFMISGLISIKLLAKVPVYLASRWRLKASNQMVLCILYIVMYMRHTSNLENAIKFAAEHIKAPLSLDLRKIFWNIEVGKYSTIKEALDAYLETWRNHNLEFVTAFHLIESSLYEPSESRRMTLLDKSLDVMLEGTYDKMMSYAHDLKNPITMLHMLGIILPILGLVIFPLVGSFMGGLIAWYHLALLYNLFLPLIVFVFGLNLLAKRPTGYSESEIAKRLFSKVYNPVGLAIFIGIIFVFIGFLPIIFHILDPTLDPVIEPLGKIFGYEEGTQKGTYIGPFGLGALLFSFFIPFGLSLALSTYYKFRTKEIIALREETKMLEREFSSALFQLGNRIGEGIPAEIAFGKVAETMSGTPTGNFFRKVDLNIRQMGMNIQNAIFNPSSGAILSYPSSLIESSMEVLIESSKKGPNVVAQSLLSISTYVDRIHKVNERLKDLLSEIISSMRSQISFLTPAIAGIVVGISSMIVSIIVMLTSQFAQFTMEEGQIGAQSQLQTLQSIFNVQSLIPPFHFQVIVGIYVLQIGFILTVLSNGIENGSDKLNEQHQLGKNLFKTTFLYILIAILSSVIFFFLAKVIAVGTQA